ncbi:MAG TPA: hypothetical protein VJX67_21415 [Blastocatellia bacterium]|nr:hypothetical protein [Blastocatellia bacterium]
MTAILADQPTLWEQANQIGATETERLVIWFLKCATSGRPITIAQIRERVRNDGPGVISEREVKQFVRDLRRDHGMPILARRGKNPGYFWCASRDEMQDFVSTFKKQAEDEMATVRKMVETNYPGLLNDLECGDQSSLL